MKKPLPPIPPTVPSTPSNWKTGDQNTPTVGTVGVLGPKVHIVPLQQVVLELVRKRLPQKPATEPNYVDPYLFETGYYESRAEYDDLMARPQTKIQLREDVENTPKKKRSSRSTK